MKKFTFKGVLDGFRSSVQAAPRGNEQEIQETLRPDHFQIKKVSPRNERQRLGRRGGDGAVVVAHTEAALRPPRPPRASRLAPRVRAVLTRHHHELRTKTL